MKDKNTREKINNFKDAIRASSLRLRLNFSKKRYRGLLKKFLHEDYTKLDKSPFILDGKHARFFVESPKNITLQVRDKIFYSHLDRIGAYIEKIRIKIEAGIEYAFGEQMGKEDYKGEGFEAFCDYDNDGPVFIE